MRNIFDKSLFNDKLVKFTHYFINLNGDLMQFFKQKKAKKNRKN